VLLAAAVLLVAVPASAQALTLSGLQAAPVSGQAGAHSDFHIHMDFGDGDVKNLTVGLPPGLIGDPNATPLCTVPELNADMCPGNSVVGSVSASATLHLLDPLLNLPATVTGSLYNLEPQAGEPARFGIVLHALPLPPPLDDAVLPPIILQSGVQLRSDYGLNTVINNIPNSTSVPLIGPVATSINSQDITLFGTAPGTGKPFMRNPTSCPGPHVTNFTAVPYSGSTATGPATFTTAGCGNLDFSPSFTAAVGAPGQTASGVLTTATTSIDQDTDEAGLLRAAVTVPADLNPNAAIFGGACSDAAFHASSCPASSRVGFAVATSPLLSQPLSGPVQIVASGTTLPNLGLDLQGQLHLLLTGTVDTNKTVVFDGLPDIPIAHFALAFTNPPGLLGTTRDLCTPPAPVFHAAFHGYNGADTSVNSSATVSGCGPSSATKAKCKKAKKKHKKKHRAAESKKKHKKKKKCKKKRKKHKKRH
jgi:hypothetical protein